MTELDLSYIAGFFDGEGSAYLSTPKASNGKRYLKVTAKISQNDRKVLDWIAESFGFGQVYEKRYKKLEDHPNWNMNHYLTFAYKQARIFLTSIEPFLKVKKNTVTSILDVVGRDCSMLDVKS